MRNVNVTWDQATPHRCGTTLVTLFATLPQIQIERSARVFARPDVPIKAFITGFCAVFVVECFLDLLYNLMSVVQ